MPYGLAEWVQLTEGSWLQEINCLGPKRRLRLLGAPSLAPTVGPTGHGERFQHRGAGFAVRALDFEGHSGARGA